MVGYGVPSVITSVQFLFDIFKIVRKGLKCCNCVSDDCCECGSCCDCVENSDEYMCCCHVKWWQDWFGWLPCCKNMQEDRRERVKLERDELLDCVEELNRRLAAHEEEEIADEL